MARHRLLMRGCSCFGEVCLLLLQGCVAVLRSSKTSPGAAGPVHGDIRMIHTPLELVRYSAMECRWWREVESVWLK